MKKILFLILIFTILMTGCSSGKYYIYQTESKIDLQPTKDNFLPYMYVPKGKHIVIKESRSTVKKAQYGSHKGYIFVVSNLPTQRNCDMSQQRVLSPRLCGMSHIVSR